MSEIPKCLHCKYTFQPKLSKITSIFDGLNTVRDPSPFSSLSDNFDQGDKSNCSLNGVFYQFSIICYGLYIMFLQ